MNAELLARLSRRAEHCLEAIESDEPHPLLIAMAVQHLWETAFAACPTQMAERFGAFIADHSLVSSAICPNCKVNKIANSASHKPMCEQCDAKIDADVQRLLEDMEGDDH